MELSEIGWLRYATAVTVNGAVADHTSTVSLLRKRGAHRNPIRANLCALTLAAGLVAAIAILNAATSTAAINRGKAAGWYGSAPLKATVISPQAGANVGSGGTFSVDLSLQASASAPAVHHFVVSARESAGDPPVRSA